MQLKMTGIWKNYGVKWNIPLQERVTNISHLGPGLADVKAVFATAQNLKEEPCL